MSYINLNGDCFLCSSTRTVNNGEYSEDAEIVCSIFDNALLGYPSKYSDKPLVQCEECKNYLSNSTALDIAKLFDEYLVQDSDAECDTYHLNDRYHLEKDILDMLNKKQKELIDKIETISLHLAEDLCDIEFSCKCHKTIEYKKFQEELREILK